MLWTSYHWSNKTSYCTMTFSTNHTLWYADLSCCYWLHGLDGNAFLCPWMSELLRHLPLHQSHASRNSNSADCGVIPRLIVDYWCCTDILCERRTLNGRQQNLHAVPHKLSRDEDCWATNRSRIRPRQPPAPAGLHSRSLSSSRTRHSTKHFPPDEIDCKRTRIFGLRQTSWERCCHSLRGRSDWPTSRRCLLDRWVVRLAHGWPSASV